jgi:type II secretory pathway pseudopilin PulG
VIVIVVIAIAAALVLLGVLAWRRRRAPVDGVASFRRQIDALSRDARRPTIDQLRSGEDDGGADEEGDEDGA